MQTKQKQSIMPQSVKNSASQGNLLASSQLANFANQKQHLKKSQIVVPGSLMGEAGLASGNINS